MKGRLLVALIGTLMLLIFIGSYFFYRAITKDLRLDDPEKSTTEGTAHISDSTPNKSSGVRSSDQLGKGTKSNNSPIQINNPIPKKNQIVVDQTLRHPAIKPDVENISGNVSSSASVKDKSNLEISLYESEEDKPIMNYDVTLQYKVNFEPLKIEKLKTNNEGRISITANDGGSIILQVFTKDFGIHSSNFILRRGNNEHKAKLHKGGSLEIHATNRENKTVEGLTLRMMNGSNFLPGGSLIFDINRGLYVLSNMPLGIVNLSFKAPGYQETSGYMIRIEAKEINQLEVKLQAAKMIYFELDINNKPDLIYVFKDEIKFKKNKENENTETPEVFKNQNNLFEYSLDDLRLTTLTIKVDKYLPQKVTLAPSKDTYKVTLAEGFSGELHISNEEGKPIFGANVTYSLRTTGYSPADQRSQTQSDKDGLALLTDLSEKMFLRLSVSHNDFVGFSEDWQFDAKTQSSKKITLKEGKGIAGKVKYNSVAVMAAQVVLFQTGNIKPLLSLPSESDGSFYFNNFASNNVGEFYIRAFHRDYGSANSGTLKFENKKLVIDLSLEPEKSVSIKLIDGSGSPLPNKKIILFNINGNPNDSFGAITDEKGCYDFFNITHGAYNILLEDESLTIKNKDFQVPGAQIILTPIPKNLKKIMVTTPGGGAFRGLLQIKNSFLKPIDLIKRNDGFYYIEFPNDLGNFLLEAQGYPIITMGSYEELMKLPGDLVYELKVGSNFKIKVIDDRDLKPIQSITVNVSAGNTKIQATPTNELGEIVFTQLNGKIVVSIKGDGYVAFREEFDLLQSKEALIKLIKGGVLKGHLTFGKNVMGAHVFLQPNFPHSIPLDADGYFIIYDMMPGEYSLSFKENFKDGRNVLSKVPTNLKIEAEKTFEINLDEYVIKRKD